MVSEFPASMANKANMVSDKSVSRSVPNKKNHGKVPKKIHKAEREKLKRDHLNELFLELGHTLEPARQNSGKASILDDASRLLRDLLSQVEGLKKENSALLTESRYVTFEKKELTDENIVLEAEIQKLQTEICSRMQPEQAWNNGIDAAPAQLRHTNFASESQEDQVTTVDPMVQAPSVVGPVFVIPIHPELQAYPEPETVKAPSMSTPSYVKRPHARYPTPLDSWPSQILAAQQPIPTQKTQFRSSGTSITNSGEEGPGK